MSEQIMDSVTEAVEKVLRLADMVEEALINARANGYELPSDAAAVAVDIMDYHSEVQSMVASGDLAGEDGVKLVAAVVDVVRARRGEDALYDCPGCNGTGRVDGGRSVWCATCDGHGGPVATPVCDATTEGQCRASDATTAAIVSATTERAEARQALRQLAESIGEPGIDADPLLCASRVNEHLELLRAERMPDDDELRALCRAAAGMSPDGRRRLRELAEACTGDPEALECALNDIAGDALHRALGGVG